ncbi:hypothetical protein GCM10027589_13340 [Actinocorallia lasiicapitis]
MRDLLRRVSVASVRELFGVVAGPLAQPGTPGARFGRLRTVSFADYTSIKAPDMSRNVAWLRKSKANAVSPDIRWCS